MEDSARPPLWERRVSRRRAPARPFCGPFADGVASQPFAAYAAPTDECSAAHSREANKRRCHRRIPPSGSALARSYTEGTISSSFPRKRESSKTPLFTGFPLSRERRKGFLKQLLLDASWKRPPALPCGSDACREGALQRDIFAGHSQKGSLRKPSRLAPLLQKRSDAAQATPRFPE
jgi:hypothetical protein